MFSGNLVAKIRFTTANPAVATGAYRCTVARTAAGRYTLTLTEPLHAEEGFGIAMSAAASGATEFCGLIPAAGGASWEVVVSTATAAAAETGSQVTVALFRTGP